MSILERMNYVKGRQHLERAISDAFRSHGLECHDARFIYNRGKVMEYPQEWTEVGFSIPGSAVFFQQFRTAQIENCADGVNDDDVQQRIAQVVSDYARGEE